MIKNALMIQGTTSDAGKTTLVAGLCRLLANQGVKVAPFKSQNMALNSAVTFDGGEIGRATAMQAKAACTQANVDMNPVLLKPNTDKMSQVIIQGKAINNAPQICSQAYYQLTMTAVVDSFERLQTQYDYILVEGAGSPAEINLRQYDIANMGFAEEVDVPVIIIADIDKGGVFAHLYGTLKLLSESEQNRVVGFVINRFRGDIDLLEPGIKWLEEETKKPVLGVLPYIHDLHLEAEDALEHEQHLHHEQKIKVVVLVYPRMSNHTDFDALRLNPDVDFKYCYAEHSIPSADLIILPGTKSTQADLSFLRAQGWDQVIERHLRYGGKVLGICGGFQMLGQSILDKNKVESETEYTQGLGYLPLQTQLQMMKNLKISKMKFSLIDDESEIASGYEIHAGITTTQDSDEVLLDFLSADRQIYGTYLHGLFDSPKAFNHIAKWLDQSDLQSIDLEKIQQDNLDKLADTLSKHLNLSNIWQY